MKVNCECTTCIKNKSEFANDLIGPCMEANEITLTVIHDDGDMACDKYTWDKLKKFRRVKDAK